MTARTILKRSNRRLYDTYQRSYVTLQDVRGLVNARVDFRILDKDSGRDITEAILWEVVTEQERLSQPVLQREFLTQIIRFQGSPREPVLRGFLEKSLELLGDSALDADGP